VVHGREIPFEVADGIPADEGGPSQEGEDGVQNLGFEGSVSGRQIYKGNGMVRHGAAVYHRVVEPDGRSSP
jgi:hypothetical protein